MKLLHLINIKFESNCVVIVKTESCYITRILVTIPYANTHDATLISYNIHQVALFDTNIITICINSN